MAEIGVAAVQQPAVADPDRDAAMAARMAGKGNEENVASGARQRPHAGEAVPIFSVGFDRRPFRHAGKLDSAVAVALDQRRRVQRRLEFGRVDMHARPWKVGEAARVIEVEMGRHDVAHVGDAETEIRDLPQRRLRDLEPRAGQGVEQESQATRVGDILHAESAVDKDEPVVTLDQKAMAAHRRRRPGASGAAEQASAARAHRSAVEMVDSHARVL